MEIECEHCGFKYDTEENDYCPACGDDNEEHIKDLEDE